MDRVKANPLDAAPYASRLTLARRAVAYPVVNPYPAEDNRNQRRDNGQHYRRLTQADRRNPRAPPCQPVDNVAMVMQAIHARILISFPR